MKLWMLIALLLVTLPGLADRLPPVSQETWNQLNRAYTALEQNNHKAALKSLDQAIRHATTSQYEKALIWRTRGSVLQLAGRPKAAAAALGKALDTHALPIELAVQTAMELAGNLITRKQYDQAISLLEHWIEESPDPPAELYLLLAQIYATQAMYTKAAQPLKKALQKNPTPPDHWHQLAVAVHYQLKQYGHCLSHLQKLLHKHPKDADYWLQLASVHQLNNQPEKAIAALEAAYHQKLLKTEQEKMMLTSLYLQHDMPFKAALFLDELLRSGQIADNTRHWSLLSQSWYQARDLKKSSTALEEAARRSDNSDLWLQLARLYQAQENWLASKAAVQTALAKGKLSDPEQAYMILGIASAHLNETKIARDAFRQARNFSDTRQQAGQWLNWLDNELIGANL